MTKANADTAWASPAAVAEAAPVALHSPLNFSALGVLFLLTLRQFIRGKRLLILSVLFLLPSVVAIIIRYEEPTVKLPMMEFALIFNMIPHILVPLTALLYASGMVQDEIEEQTLTYLLVRPLPKWSIYLTKLLASLLMAVVMATVFTSITALAIHAREPGVDVGALVLRMAKVSGVMGLALVGWCTLFGFFSMVTKRALVAGVVYVILFEGVLANQPIVLRKGTVMYYYRILTEHWVGIDWKALNPMALNIDQWSLDLNTAPGAWQCVLILLSGSILATALAAFLMQTREFRVKTPEGN